MITYICNQFHVLPTDILSLIDINYSEYITNTPNCLSRSKTISSCVFEYDYISFPVLDSPAKVMIQVFDDSCSFTSLECKSIPVSSVCKQGRYINHTHTHTLIHTHLNYTHAMIGTASLYGDCMCLIQVHHNNTPINPSIHPSMQLQQSLPM